MKMAGNRNRGVTLIEALVALVLSCGVMGGAYYYWSSVMREVNRGKTRQALEQDLRLIMKTFNADVKSMVAGSFAPLRLLKKESIDEQKLVFDVFGEVATKTVSWFFEPLENGGTALSREEKDSTGKALKKRVSTLIDQVVVNFEGEKDGKSLRHTLTLASGTANPGGKFVLVSDEKSFDSVADDPPGPNRFSRIDFTVSGKAVVPGTMITETLTLKTSAGFRQQNTGSEKGFISNF